MPYNVLPTPKFKKEAKRIIKKYPSLKSELYDFEKSLAENPIQGTSLENNTFKIRLVSKSKGKGKRSGARILTYVLHEELEVYLLTIYDKSEIENVDDKTLRKLVAEITRI